MPFKNEDFPRVQFRSGDELDRELAARADKGRSIHAVAKRDLERYYELLGHSIPTFTVNEAMLIVDALNGVLLRAESISILWANVADGIRHDGLAEKWEVDGATLVERLRNLTYFEAMAIGDAVERSWSGDYHATDMRERVVAVGLAKADA